MELKRDAHGRPIGLQWPDRPVEPEVIKKHVEAAKKPNKGGGGSGRVRQQMCGKDGNGPHNLDETGVKLARGGRYCGACKKEYKRNYQKNMRAKNPEKWNEMQRRYRANKKKKEANE